MAGISTRIDVTVTRRGRLVLLAEGASAEGRLSVRLSGGALEISDGSGVLARAARLPEDAAAAFEGRAEADVVLIAPDGTERLHDGLIEAGI